MNSKEAYQNLFDLSKKAHLLVSMESLLQWDHETHMPSGGAPLRAEQLKTIASLVHSAKTAPEMRAAIDSLIDIERGTIKASHLTLEQENAVKRWRRDFKIDSALPLWFVEEFAKLTSHAMEAWKEARSKGNFSIFAPYLETIIEMNQRKAEFLGFKETAYDALLDLYEPGATTEKTKTLFQSIRDPLVDLLQRISKQSQIDADFLKIPMAEEAQMKWGKKFLQAIGYDFLKGNVSKSTHPFSSSIGPGDCRITTRIDINDFMSNLKVVLHEGGHALYSLQLPEDQFGSPLGEAISMAVHESQSRWWECYIGLGKPFWNYYYPLLQKELAPLGSISLDDFWRAINKVQPSFIRVEADEMTYPLHVILRFELEQMLISGKLAVKDVPEIWNAKMQELLGITPPNDKLGCLQDVHWSMGAFGYFPTYLMGNAYAAFMMEAFEKQQPDWQDKVSQGDLFFIKDWLKNNVHRYGRQYNSDELLREIGQKEFSSEPYLNYLEKKYSEIYRL